MVKATTKKAALTESDATETTAKSVAKKPSAKRQQLRKLAPSVPALRRLPSRPIRFRKLRLRLQ